MADERSHPQPAPMMSIDTPAPEPAGGLRTPGRAHRPAGWPRRWPRSPLPPQDLKLASPVLQLPPLRLRPAAGTTGASPLRIALAVGRRI
ncbi:MAG: hypothetical protein MZW92_65610 [Comamonadaceae bacterium]|nr:hypothetical protein [Comamonadaceae bacterium]